MKKILWLLMAVLTILLIAGLAAAETLAIPEGVTEIGEEAFWGDMSLDEVVLPEGVRTIGDRAFAASSARRFVLPAWL